MIKEKVGKILTMDSGIPNTTIHDESTVTHIDQQNQSFPRRPFVLREGIFAFFFPLLSFSTASFFSPSDFIIGIGLMVDCGSRGSGISDSFAR